MVKACKLFHLTEDFSVDTASTDNASVAVMCVAHWKKKNTASCVVAPEWYFAWKGRGAWKKKSICCWNGGVALRAFSSIRSFLSGASVPETRRKKKSHCAMQRREHALFTGPLQQNLFRCFGVCILCSGLVERAWPRSFCVSVSLTAKKWNSGCSCRSCL